MNGTSATADLSMKQFSSARIVWGSTLVACVLVLAIFNLFNLANAFPETWEIDITAPIDDAADWVVETFQFILKPASVVIRDLVDWINDQFLAAPFGVVIVALALITGRVGGWRLALLTAASFSLMAALGLWRSSIITLTVMLVSIALSVTSGIAIGIAAAKNDRFDAALRPVLDAMQTMPAFVYLIPVLMLFGLGNTSAVVATMIYALPPVIRLTNLGIRQVPSQAKEAARSFGSTPLQMLLKVELPMARQSILIGINQTVMMALSMVIFVALIGASGLGKEIWLAMRRLQIGNALEGGVAVVLLAVVLDRFVYACTRNVDATGNTGERQSGLRSAIALPFLAVTRIWDSFRDLIAQAARNSNTGVRVAASLFPYAIVIAAVWVISTGVFDLQKFPREWMFSTKSVVDPAVKWLTLNAGDATTAIRNNVYIYGLGPMDSLLRAAPWPIIIGLFAVGAWRMAGASVALGTLFAFAFIGFTGMWDATITTLGQVAVALLASVLLGVPFGILNAKSDRLSAITRPVLDTMQTLPAFVYFPVVVMLFKVGAVSGILATIVYAIPPVVRLTELGLRQVPYESIEAAHSFGTTRRQMLWKVELPLALPSVMMGINQTLMMSFAMVAYAALIGAGGLGLVVLKAIGQFDIGNGFVAGLSIVLLALIFDRASQGWINRYKETFQQD